MRVKVKPAWRVKSGCDRVYHTEDCQHVRKATEGVFVKKDTSELDDSRECKECAGRSETGQTKADFSTYQDISDEDTTPEDYGLSPMGER